MTNSITPETPAVNVKPLVWKNNEARSSSGDLYTVHRLSENVWQAYKNGTAFTRWFWTQAGARSAAQADCERVLTPPQSPVLHIVFDGPPSHDGGRFVEVETPDGKSVRAGEWHERPDGLWELRLSAIEPVDTPALVAAAYEAAAEACDCATMDGIGDILRERAERIRTLSSADAKARLDAMLRDARNEGIEAARQQWRQIATDPPPHSRIVLLGWRRRIDGDWMIETGAASWGARNDRSVHAQATHWQPLDEAYAAGLRVAALEALKTKW
jgi:hypothetical protein